MNRVDLHVHSLHSKHPSEWFLQRLGARESYTDPERVYALAKKRGARFVTLTDHNTIDGALELAARHPADCFVSTEATTYFPEDGCKVHVLCYGITPAQFNAIQKARDNIYNLRDYLRLEGIACSVAHATFSINDRLTVAHLEKLVLLFDVFEGINGTRGRVGNVTWQELLRHLTPAHLARLAARHGIEPWSDTPWIKGLTGGSDDHAGLFIGATYTLTEADSIPELLEALRHKRTRAGGRYGDHKSLAYAIYKIAAAYASQKGGAKGLPGLLASILFAERGPALRERLLVRRLGFRRSARDRILSRFLDSLMVISRASETHGPEWEVEQAYEALAVFVDNSLSEMAQALERGARGGDAPDLLQGLGTLLPATLFATPFFSTLRLLNRNRMLNDELLRAFELEHLGGDGEVLWFSDTLADLNGVSVTLQELALCALRGRRPLRLVGCRTEAEQGQAAPPGLIDLPCAYAMTPDFYPAHTLRVPSLLRALDRIAAHQPRRIVISTPGPVGLLGLAAARLLGIPCTGVYHTDFARMAEQITADPGTASMVEGYTRWFFDRMDELRVPSEAYISLLADRGMDRQRMKRFRRGVDAAFLEIDEQTLSFARAQWFADGRPTLLYAGRLGREKNLELLAQTHRALRAAGCDVRLVIAGDGPHGDEFKALLADLPDVVFTGRLQRRALRACYVLADIFIFPSTTDTFGMAVLEAQAFGLPALVTDVGGPQELVQPGVTGYVLSADTPAVWAETALRLVTARRDQPDDYARWRNEIRAASQSRYNWESTLDEIMGPGLTVPLATDIPPPAPGEYFPYGQKRPMMLAAT